MRKLFVTALLVFAVSITGGTIRSQEGWRSTSFFRCPFPPDEYIATDDGRGGGVGMSVRRPAVSLFLGALVLLAMACSEDNPIQTRDPVPDALDSISPAAPTDLRVIGVEGAVVRLAFTATGDDSLAGRASAFDVRMSLTTLTPTDFDSAAAVADVPSPPDSGDSVVVAVNCPDTATTYSFAVKVLDDAGNASPMSNVVSATTDGYIDSVPPGQVVDLAGEPIQGDSIRLTWTAVGDDGDTGTAAAYSVRWSAAPITAAMFAALPAVSEPPLPSAAGTREEAIIPAPSADTLLYFALRARDEAGNWSAISNNAEVVSPRDTGILWRYTYDSAGCVAGDITELANGDILITGNSLSGGVLVRLSSDGRMQSSHSYPGVSLAAISDDGEFLVGHRVSAETDRDLWLARIGPAGNVVFDTTYAWVGSQTGLDIVHKDDRLYMAAGYVMAVSGSGELLWVDSLWRASGCGEPTDRASVGSLAPTEAGILGSGSLSWQDPYFPPRDYIYFGTIDSLGEVLGVYTPEPDGAGGGKVAGDPPTGYAAVGRSWRGFEIIRLDGGSNPLWQTVYFSGQDPSLFSVIPTPDGGSLAVGSDNGAPFATSSNMLLVRFSSDGEILWQRSFGEGGFNSASAVVRGADGSFCVAGTTKLYTAERTIQVFKCRE